MQWIQTLKRRRLEPNAKENHQIKKKKKKKKGEEEMNKEELKKNQSLNLLVTTGVTTCYKQQ